MAKKINIIGLGEIGVSTLHSMLMIPGTRDKFEFYLTDIDKSKQSLVENYNVEKFSTEPFKKCDVYIICVWTTDQALEVLRKIRKLNKRMVEYSVCIETTLDPSKLKEFQEFPANESLAAFPHRYNPYDPHHGVFNQTRVLGAYGHSAYIFYSYFMKLENIVTTSFANAVWSKVLENAYRYCEIVLAQEFSCSMGADKFKEVRELANSKWNIDIKQAQDGVMGKCLPKDMQLFVTAAPLFTSFFQEILKSNKDYINAKDYYVKKFGTGKENQ